MVAILLTILITYIVTSFFGYVVHWSLHQSWAGRFNVSHMTHHLKLYPPSDFYSETYRDPGKDNTVKFFAFAAIPLLLAPVVLYFLGILPLSLMITVLVVEGIVGFLHDYIHDAFHITDHWMSRVPVLRDIFGVWVKLHYLHHVDMGKNYGIFVFHWDHVFRTFWKKQ